MHIPSPNDILIEWDPSNVKSTKDAQTRWASLAAQGYVFLKSGIPVSAWNPEFRNVIASPSEPPVEVVARWPSRKNIP